MYVVTLIKWPVNADEPIEGEVSEYHSFKAALEYVIELYGDSNVFDAFNEFEGMYYMTDYTHGFTLYKVDNKDA